MKNNADEIRRLKERLGQGTLKTVIIPHISADGDAAGSCSALSEVLQQVGIEWHILTCDFIPEYLRFLKNISSAISFQEKPEEYLLVDGYNIIFAWPELRELAQINLDSARDKLMDILCNYQGYQGCRLILVYDAYKVKGNPGSVMKYHNIEVVYTKEAETADQYIERTTHELGAKPQKYRVTVATSDALEQMIIWGNGAVRMSALGLKAAVESAGAEYFNS
mgnify:CR=1 FL=1